jgi:hypothetical protein
VDDETGAPEDCPVGAPPKREFGVGAEGCALGVAPNRGFAGVAEGVGALEEGFVMLPNNELLLAGTLGVDVGF